MKIIKISAVWCPGCLVMNKVWKQIKEKYPNIDICELDYDIDSDEVMKYDQEKKLPLTIFLDKDGNELERHIGELTFAYLERKINEYENH